MVDYNLGDDYDLMIQYEYQRCYFALRNVGGIELFIKKNNLTSNEAKMIQNKVTILEINYKNKIPKTRDEIKIYTDKLKKYYEEYTQLVPNYKIFHRLKK